VCCAFFEFIPDIEEAPSTCRKKRTAVESGRGSIQVYHVRVPCKSKCEMMLRNVTYFGSCYAGRCILDILMFPVLLGEVSADLCGVVGQTHGTAGTAKCPHTIGE
jgi:hypothetical protein